MAKETPEGWESTYRPPVERRWIGGRTEPGTILLRSEWLYSHPDPDRPAMVPESRKVSGLHPFSRCGSVVRTDWPHWIDGFSTDVAANVWRAIEEFGDDADIVIEVRRARPEELIPDGD